MNCIGRGLNPTVVWIIINHSTCEEFGVQTIICSKKTTKRSFIFIDSKVSHRIDHKNKMNITWKRNKTREASEFPPDLILWL